MSFRWTCPYCNHKCTIGDKNFDYQTHSFGLSNKYKNKLGLKSIVIVCPNAECEEITINSYLYKSTNYSGYPYTEPDMIRMIIFINGRFYLIAMQNHFQAISLNLF